MKNLKYVLLWYWSEKPKVGTVECLVPSCKRKWWLEGSNQGFVKSSALSHSYAHWRKFHKEHEHDGEHPMVCPKCMEASEQESERRR